ncbi:MAG: DUF2341 domain-containing protein [Nanoarchaeota archaeon]|nr:DUF2341 domain-containing protein [Nanoarchaeota archaeon]
MNNILERNFVKRLFYFKYQVFIIFLYSNLIFLLIFSSSSSFSYDFFNPPWEDDTQPFRVEFNVTGASSDLDRYTMQIDIDSSFMGSIFDFDTHRDSIRMYYYNRTANTSILIPHYFLEYDSTLQEAELQFKVPFISSTTGAELVLYFGNTFFDNNEDFCSTFIHCDLFEEPEINSIYEIGDFDLVTGTDFSIVDGNLQIRAGGADTWTGNDEYGSVFLKDIEGDIDVQVAIIFQGNPDQWNKAGIMIRNDISQPTVSTGYVFQAVTRDNGYAFQRDTTGNGYLNQNTVSGSRVLPSYLRIVKSDQTFTGFYSTTTPSTWTSITSQTLTTANSIQDVGLSSTSHAGATLDTVRFDNFTIKRHTTDTIIVDSFAQNNLPNELFVSIIQPSTIAITNVEQNSIFTVDTNISCFSYDSTTCEDVDIFLEFNDSNIVSTSSTTPLFTTSSNPQSCTLDAGDFCIRSFDINLTGLVGEVYDVQVIAQSSLNNIEDSISDLVRSRVILGTFIAFNESILDIGTTTQFSGSISQSVEVSSNFGDNSNIEITCVLGDCTTITPDISLILNLLDGSTQNITFTCSDQLSGQFSAQFELTSTQSSVTDFLQVSCEIEQVFGPITITKFQPSSSGVTLLQNESVILRYNVSCQGECGDVEIGMYSPFGNWWNLSWQNRVEINITNTVFTPEDFQILVQINSSLLDDYQWLNSCSDLRFIDNSSNSLLYWIEECNEVEEEAFVWVRLEDSIPADELYQITMYYNNEDAISQSSPQTTFREDEIHLVTGFWNDGAAPLTSNHINNNNDANILKSTIDINGWDIFGSGYVTSINQNINIYGSGGADDDFYYSRYRFLFIPSTTTTHTFRTNSDDGSEIGIWNLDGYGTGIRTPISVVTGTQTRLAFWYGGHANQALCNTGGTDGSQSLIAGNGYWIDYVMNERTGGQLAQMCINRGFGFELVSVANLGGEIFARTYLDDDPQVVISQSQSGLISTIADEVPLWTSNINPQNCIIGELDWCIVEFEVFGTGESNNSYDIFLRASSNYSQVEFSQSLDFTITITQDPIPKIILLEPSNDSKFIDSLESEFRFFINGSSSTYYCNVYINSVLQIGEMCPNLQNSSIFINISGGLYEYYIEVLDEDQNSTLINSQIFEFRKILFQHKTLIKEINFLESYIYEIELTLQNNLNFDQEFKVFEFVSEFFNYASFNLFYDIFIEVSGLFTGDLLEWSSVIVSSNSNETISYAVSSNNGSQSKIKDLFIIGFE